MRPCNCPAKFAESYSFIYGFFVLTLIAIRPAWQGNYMFNIREPPITHTLSNPIPPAHFTGQRLLSPPLNLQFSPTLTTSSRSGSFFPFEFKNLNDRGQYNFIT
ncbi:hypothetical protein Cflav_PD0994 [Pedosphaera parvula Ellin514]|uniref:Uncharacterized protein n=1 Tax=Pedosphaera parvula (strain Ellin514) TaxID=320771 RepID=B9XPC6_PEDPL|nr:hypothetical protein Cflav_PD0994 [Pedosphaera parvula Ellin514]